MIRVLDLPAGPMSVRVEGQGAPLVLLHGFSLDHRMWAGQVEHFADRHQVIAPDLRGFGNTPPPDGDYAHDDDLAALLEILQVERVTLCGLSLGANVALAFAARHPRQVSRLVLASPGYAGHDWGEEERPPVAAARIAAEQGVDAVRRFWLEHPLFASLKGAARSEVEAMVGAYSGWHWQAPGRGARINDTGPLADIGVPVLVVSGREDVAGYRACARALADDLPQGRLITVDGAGHMVNLDAPDIFNALLEDSLIPVEEIT